METKMEERKAGLVIVFNCELSHEAKASTLRALADDLEDNENALAGPLICPETSGRVGFYTYQWLDKPPGYCGLA